MSKADIQEYLELSEHMREDLEAAYRNTMFNGNYVQAHEYVKMLMAYKLIDADDPRVSPKTKMFKGDIEHPGVDVSNPESWGVYDYRRIGTDFIPSYLYCGLKDYVTIHLDVIPHWGKRVEGSGEGDVKIGGFKHRIRMSLANKSQYVHNAVELMGKLAIEQNTNLGSLDSIHEEAMTGCLRIYQLTAMTSVETYYKNFGFVVLKMDDAGKIQASVIPNYKSIMGTWVGIPQFMKRLGDAINEVVSVDEGVNIMYITPPDEYGRQQSGMIKYSDEKEESRKALVAKEEAKRKEEEANKKAKPVKKASVVIH